jgi:hypothetical protein
MPDRGELVAAATAALAELPATGLLPDDATIGHDAAATSAIGRALESICDLARLVGVDPEQALRDRARSLSALVRATEDASTPI